MKTYDVAGQRSFSYVCFHLFCRQPTLFDKICYEVDDEGCQMGSRVYGDCDALMREIMKNVMAEDDLKEWEEGREARMEEYDKQRVKPGGDL